MILVKNRLGLGGHRGRPHSVVLWYAASESGSESSTPRHARRCYYDHSPHLSRGDNASLLLGRVVIGGRWGLNHGKKGGLSLNSKIHER